MLSRIGLVNASVTQVERGTPNPGVPMLFPPPHFPQNHRKLPRSRGLAAMALQQALAGIPALTPDHTKPLLLPSGSRRLALSQAFLPASSLDTDPC